MQWTLHFNPYPAELDLFAITQTDYNCLNGIGLEFHGQKSITELWKVQSKIRLHVCAV